MENRKEEERHTEALRHVRGQEKTEAEGQTEGQLKAITDEMGGMSTHAATS